MICPKCKSEYREGFTVCSDCGVALLASLREEQEDVETQNAEVSSSYVEETASETGPRLELIFQTRSSTILERLVLLLESREIPYLVQFGTAMTLLYQNKLEWQAVLHVPPKYADEVKSMIKRLESGGSVREYSECPYCKSPLREEDQVILCESCQTGHHLGCWHEKGGCSVFGCRGEMGRIQ